MKSPERFLLNFSVLIILFHFDVINTEETKLNLIENTFHQVDDKFDKHSLTNEPRGLRKEILSRLSELRAEIPSFKSLEVYQTDQKRATLTNGTRCNTDLRNLAASLGEKWTLPLIDSYGKPPSGILRGNLFWPGNYDQCRSFETRITNLFPSGFEGRYCLLKMKISNGDSLGGLTTGICVPNSCASEDLRDELANLVNFLSNIPIIQNYSDSLRNLTVNCLPESSTLNSASIVFTVLVSSILALVVAGTGYDLYERYFKVSNSKTNYPRSDNKGAEQLTNEDISVVEPINEQERVVHESATNSIGKFLLCFSALKNGESLLDTSVKSGQMNCLHGIRFISMAWIILGHVYDFGSATYSNPLDLAKQFGDWTFLGVSNSEFSVDTFFFLSGLLLTYLFLKDSEPFTLKKLGSLYSHRYVRLTPVYMIVAFGFGTLYNFTGDGPYWPYQDRDGNACTKYFWTNLLYINNFDDQRNTVIII